MVRNALFTSFISIALALVQPIFAGTYRQAMQLQLADVNGAPVDNTQFWITVEIVKNKDQITLNFPAINFQVGQCANSDPDCTSPMPGYIITTAGYLPPNLCPNTLIPISVNAASGDGLAPTFTNGTTPPVPASGFTLSIDNSGGVSILQSGAAQGVISVGPHNVLPCSVTYTESNSEQIGFNFQLSQGQIDITQFTDSVLMGSNIRDSHINDAFSDTFAWAWTDNHNLDPTTNVLNLYVLVGKIDKKGRLKLGKPIQLTNFSPPMFVWDTSVAINRQNTNNIVVSYGVVNEDASFSARAVTFDGGKTWGGVFDGVNSSAYNGEINYQTAEGFGDIPGVGADRYGNFWYGVTDLRVDSANIPYLLISTDQGVSWNLAYSFPSVTDPDNYDYPHLLFGENGSGQYGLWYYTDYFDANEDLFPGVAFIPITGLGGYGASTTTFLTSFPNSIATPTVAVSNDGRLWALGPSETSGNNYNEPQVAIFKSSGPIDQNYAGPWIFGFQNQLNSISPNIYQFLSVPSMGYFLSVNGLLYDNQRQALYAMFSASYPPLSQNMHLYFAISRNNGLTWSSPYNISTTAFANRGFNSMALDNGNLYIGWYDGRNDPSQKKIQYFGGIIPAKLLDNLVNKLQNSNPQYTTASQGSSTPPP